MARRTVGGIAAAALLLGLVAVVPVVADASSAAARDSGTPAAASPSLAASDLPFDPQPLVLLLVAGLVGGMAVLAREPAPERSRTSR